MIVLCNGTETSVSSLVHSVHIQTQSIPENYDSNINYDDRGSLSKKINCIVLLIIRRVLF